MPAANRDISFHALMPPIGSSRPMTLIYVKEPAADFIQREWTSHQAMAARR